MPLRDIETPLASEITATVEERLAVAEKESSPETIRAQWRGVDRVFHVISMPVKQLYLNPTTHRVSAQRVFDPKRNEVLEAHPWSAEAQEYLADLLRAHPSAPGTPDPEFEILKAELAKSGQQAPGLMTRTGVLVDGNTRCVALRDLGEEHIRVGILPADTSLADVSALELRIQLRKDKRRDYPYVNQLISIDEQIRNGRTPKDVASEWNINLDTLEKDMWAFQLMHEAVERSRTAGGHQLTLLTFNDQRESLREIARVYRAIKGTDPEGAERLRESRLAALVLRLPKTALRHLDGDFHTRYVEKRLPSALKTAAPEAQSVAIPGLDVAVQDHGDDTRTVKALTDRILQANAAVLAGDDDATKAAELIAGVTEAFRDAAKVAAADENYRKKQSAVSDRVQDAADLLIQAADEHSRSLADRTLDLEAVDAALMELRSAMTMLAKRAARGSTEPGDGVSWLLEAVQD
ncbi:hypothetical protein [Promicromonospora sp. NPDC060271]|uniref:hypothetical protein n=1 Tax=Promicromonospora sp. NPDC060271 TaxID=3347089 RepID=UPI00365C8C71